MRVGTAQDDGWPFAIQEHHVPEGRAGQKARQGLHQDHPGTDHRGPHRACPTRPPIRGCAPPSWRPARPTCRRTRSSARSSAAPAARRGEAYEEVRYEGYGPGGVAVIVEALTDNRNRTASEVRAAFTKAGGALGETNSVSFMFDRVGEIVLSGRGGERRRHARGRDRGRRRRCRERRRAARRDLARPRISTPCATRWRADSARPTRRASSGARRPRSAIDEETAATPVQAARDARRQRRRAERLRQFRGGRRRDGAARAPDRGGGSATEPRCGFWGSIPGCGTPAGGSSTLPATG